MTKPTVPLVAGDRVRHRSTGELGTFEGIDQPDEWAAWALVRWDDDVSCLRDSDGLSRVAPRVIERVAS